MLCGITVFFFPFCNSYGLYGFVVALYGLFTTFFILKTIVLVEIVGIENLTSAFSLLNLFEGIAALTLISVGMYQSDTHHFQSLASFSVMNFGVSNYNLNSFLGI